MAAARPIGSTPSSAPVCAFPPSTALKPIKLTRTAKGWSAFEMLFKAHLGPQLGAMSLNIAMHNKMLVATDARQAALFKHTFDRLVIALENETDLIESIAENCMALKHFCTSSSSLLGSQSRPASRASAAS
jgi:kynureninase